MGTVASLAGPGDILIVDKLAHASILDGVFASGAKYRVFRHNDMDSLEAHLKAANLDRKGGVLIVTEGVFGMRGDLGNLPDLCALKAKYDARVFVDDAHGMGVMGARGLGSGEHFGVQDQVDISHLEEPLFRLRLADNQVWLFALPESGRASWEP